MEPRDGFPAMSTQERLMAERLISADNHIDMTYCPPDLWSDAAPKKWTGLVPRTDERDDGLHWIRLTVFDKNGNSTQSCAIPVIFQ